MGKLKKLLLLGMSFVSLLLATGCASIEKLGIKSPDEDHFSQSYQTDSTKSFALNVMSAAGRVGMLRDIKKPDNFDISPNHGAYGTLVETALIAGAWTALNGVGQLVSVATIGRDRVASDYPQVFAWVPKNLVGTKEGAEDLLLKELIDSVKSHYKVNGYVERTSIPTIDGGFFEAKNCSPVGVKAKNYDCTVQFNVYSHLNILNGERSIKKQMVLTKSPSFEKPGDSFFTFSGVPRGYASISDPFPKQNDLGTKTERFIGYSKELPSWVYIYLPQRTSSKNEEDYPNLPILINQGNVHYFFKPEAK